MLKQRVITALVLLAMLLPAMMYPDHHVFWTAALILIAAAAWEWGNLNGCEAVASVALGAACVALCLGSWALQWTSSALQPLWLAATGAWVLLGALTLRAGVPAWSRVRRGVRLVAGLVALWLAWLALAQARAVGVNFLLSILALVWIADIFAYFFGRALGGRLVQARLAPGISPGKTWEGVWGGMLGVLLLGVAWVAADQNWHTAGLSLFSHLLRAGYGLLFLAVLFLTAMSVVGDLLESLVKRAAGVKDSSGLLPGHGGVLDRVDALLPTLPIAMMLYSLRSA